MRAHYVLLVAVAFGQQTPEPLVRTTTRVVQVNVVVTDKKGAPVADLAQPDFEVLENGKPQQIRFFSVDRGEQTRGSLSELPAGVYSNRIEYKGAAPQSVTAILVDLVNTPPGYYGRAKPELQKFLRNMNPRYRTALYSLQQSGLRVLHDFSTDTALLSRKVSDFRELRTAGISEETLQAFAEAVKAAEGPAQPTGGGDAYAAAAELIAWSDNLQRSFRANVDVRLTLEALTAIANRMRAIPGRKNLVWLSTGFPLLLEFAAGRGMHKYSVQPDFARAVRALNDANVSVYPVDSRGLMGAAMDHDIVSDRAGSALRSSAEIAAYADKRSTLESIARQTGGRYFYGREVGEALPAVFKDTEITYTLAYYPTDPKDDGSYRRISVKTNRSGLVIRHRPGYYAISDPRSAEERRKADLLSTVWSPIDATALPFEAWIERQGGGRYLVVHLGGNEFTFQPTENGFTSRLELILVQKNAAGKQVDGVFENVDLRLTEQRAHAVRQHGYTHKKAIELKPDTAVLRVVVRNATSGALGSVSIPVLQ